MKQQVFYRYLGTNGIIDSPVHLEDIYYIRKIRLTAESQKALTKDGKNLQYRVIVPEDEVNDWYEIDAPVGQE